MVAKIDFTYGRPALIAVRDAAQRNDLRALDMALSTGLTGGHDRVDRVRAAVNTFAARRGAQVPGLDEWLRAQPGSTNALVLRGAVETVRAWEVRGDDLAGNTPVQRLRDFATMLEQAERYCRAAAQADPSDPAPWAYLLKMARGQQVGAGELLRRRAEADARAPHHLGLHVDAAIGLGPMWGGTHEQALEHVRTWVAAAPAGTMMPALYFIAQFERQKLDGRRIAREPQARTGAHEASARLPVRAAATPDEYLAHNYAAAWYVLSREPGRANAHFKLIGGYVVPEPWEAFAANSMGTNTVAIYRGKRQNALLRLPL